MAENYLDKLSQERANAAVSVKNFLRDSAPQISVNVSGSYVVMVQSLENITKNYENTVNAIETVIPNLVIQNNPKFVVTDLSASLDNSGQGFLYISGSNQFYTGSYHYDSVVKKFFSGKNINEISKKELIYRYKNNFNAFDYASVMNNQIDYINQNKTQFLEQANKIILNLQEKYSYAIQLQFAIEEFLAVSVVDSKAALEADNARLLTKLQRIKEILISVTGNAALPNDVQISLKNILDTI